MWKGLCAITTSHVKHKITVQASPAPPPQSMHFCRFSSAASFWVANCFFFTDCKVKTVFVLLIHCVLGKKNHCSSRRCITSTIQNHLGCSSVQDYKLFYACMVSDSCACDRSYTYLSRFKFKDAGVECESWRVTLIPTHANEIFIGHRDSGLFTRSTEQGMRTVSGKTEHSAYVLFVPNSSLWPEHLNIEFSLEHGALNFLETSF